MFTAAGLYSEQDSHVAQLVGNLAQNFSGMGQIDPKLARVSIGTEDANVVPADSLRQAVAGLRTMISRSRPEGNGVQTLTVAQEQAAIIAGVLGADPISAMSVQPASVSNLAKFASATTKIIGNDRIPDILEARPSLEAFDDRSNKSLQNFSIAYNLEASRQHEFGEAFYPTVVVTPESVGFNVSIRLILTYSEVQRAASGAINNFNRQNVIRALIDASILAADHTRLIPVYRKAGTANPATDSYTSFVDAAMVATKTLTIDDAPLTTSALAVGATFSLLGICQTDAMLAQGLNDQTDMIDSSVRLETVYVKLTDGTTTEVFSFDTKNLPMADFNAAPQGNTKLMQLNFTTTALEFTANTKTVAGAASTLLAGMSTNVARIQVSMYGSLIQDVGTTTVNAQPVTVYAVNDVNGNALDKTTGAGATVAALFNGSAVIGYDLLAFRTNSNRRQRGKLLDTQELSYLYTVPLLPPITSLRPVTQSDSTDSQRLSDIITATRAQTANRAVTALLDARNLLEAYADQPDVVLNQPQLFGVASQLVTPAFLSESIDAAQKIDSLTSAQRAADLQAMLTNLIRDMATRLYVSSGYGPASEAMYEGQPPKTVVIIGTDPILYRYLTLTGDTRLMGDMFDYKIVMSYDSRMAGRIMFSFGHEASFNSGTVDPLHFGTMAWRPELTVMLPSWRSGSNPMELTVTPSYRHVNNLPVMGEILVSNISSVIGGKVAVGVHNLVVTTDFVGNSGTN
jgi:hypothetical protein